MIKVYSPKVVSLVVLLLMLSVSAEAGEPTECIRQTTDRILGVLSDPDLKGSERSKERRQHIRAAVDERFDWEEISKRALGKNWQKRTTEEREAFVNLFGKLVERTYMDKVEGYSGEKVQYVGERVVGKYSEVKVLILTNKNLQISVDYRLMQKQEGWMIYDVIIEGISMVKNYRMQFNHILKKSSFGTLLEKLREKKVED